MGKRKRSDSDKNDTVEKLLKKVKKLVQKRRRISSESSDDTPKLSSEHSVQLDLISDLEPQDEIPITEAPLEEGITSDNDEELDPDILQLLGSDPTQNKSFCDNLHKDLATRWKHILLNGLPKDDKVDLLKHYLPAENCTNMKAPVLNPEIKTGLSEINIKKDTYSEQKQNQLSSCISAIGKTLNIALSNTENVPHEIIKTLSDAGRMLCDTHYRESLSRRFNIVNSLSKQKRDILKNSTIDDHLFGSNLSEHLKSSKAISQSASELKFNNGKSSHVQRQPSRYPNALNARGAPRAPTAEPRVYPYQTRRPPLPPPPPPALRERRAPTTSRQRPSQHPQATRRR